MQTFWFAPNVSKSYLWIPWLKFACYQCDLEKLGQKSFLLKFCVIKMPPTVQWPKFIYLGHDLEGYTPKMQIQFYFVSNAKRPVQKVSCGSVVGPHDQHFFACYLWEMMSIFFCPKLFLAPHAPKSYFVVSNEQNMHIYLTALKVTLPKWNKIEKKYANILLLP